MARKGDGKPTPPKSRKRVPSDKPGQPRARTAQQLERQEKAFLASVIDGKSVREIAAELGVDKDTVVSDIRHEEQRRADENAERREADKARSIAFYETVARRALRRAEISDEILEQIRDGAECEKKVSDRSFDAALKARERIDKLIGLDAPTKVDLGLQQLMDALE
ncbi:MAG: hypothetical protein JWM87_718 [Candidatus Eremiobacteraeota bacterium]|nr:hypothetical protein [Candidatus Eremiobacteraeota bacterium]